MLGEQLHKSNWVKQGKSPWVLFVSAYQPHYCEGNGTEDSPCDKLLLLLQDFMDVLSTFGTGQRDKSYKYA